jgi:RNA polymerase sigma-70 factor (ECF subfamily)
MTESISDDSLLGQAADGDGRALGELLEQHRDRLGRMVQCRLDRRLRSRLNPSDVLQDAFLEASKRLGEYVRNPEVPFFVWLRFITGQRIAQLHRYHLGTRVRDAARSMSIYPYAIPAVSSADLAARLVGRLTSPSLALRKAELRQRLFDVLNGMDDIDREILTMRHFEQLSNLEAAHVLHLSPSAASNRYMRALERLRGILATCHEISPEP